MVPSKHRSRLVAVVLIGALAACSSPYESNDGAPSPLPPATSSCDGASALKCGDHGRCEGTPAACVCQPSYAGTSCDTCSEGFQDRDGDGTCTPSCAAMKCGAHERCDDVSGIALCDCAVGYVREAEGCVFRGGPADSSFSQTPSPWSATGNASLESTAKTSALPGALDDGWARFHGAGSVTQSFDMPAVTDAEPLAMELQAGCKGQCSNVDRTTMAIALGDRALDVPLSFDALTPRRVCLGDRAFGRKVTLAASTFVSAPIGVPDEDAFLDQLRFTAAPDCPLPGVVANGDFETSGGWTTGGQGTTEVATALGTGGSRGGHLVGTGCEKPSLASVISVPETMPRPALLFSIRGTRDRETTVSLDGKPVASLRGSGAFEQAVVCLPEYARGFAPTLKLTAGERVSSCTALGLNDVVVDDFTVASHPSCALAPHVLDGDFERVSGNAWAEGVGDGVSLAVVHGVNEAHGGTSLMQLSTFVCPRTAFADQWISAPARPTSGATASGGPAISFWYRSVNAAGATMTASAGTLMTLPEAATWTQKKLCLPPSSWGRTQYLGFAVSTNAAACNARLLVDDLTAVIDADCPAN